MSWVIDCGHWHCPDRYDTRHAHSVASVDCQECQDEPTPSDRAQRLTARAEAIAEKKNRPTKEQP